MRRTVLDLVYSNTNIIHVLFPKKTKQKERAAGQAQTNRNHGLLGGRFVMEGRSWVIKAILQDEENKISKKKKKREPITGESPTPICKDTRWLSVRRADEDLSPPPSSHFFRNILAKSELDRGLVSPAVLSAAAGSCSAAVPFSTLPLGAACRCRERGSKETWVRPLPLLGEVN